MDRTTVISRAKEALLSDGELRSMLSLKGVVRVNVLLELPCTPMETDCSIPRRTPIVTFTIEDHALFGRRLLVEFEGVKEFCA